ncbi:hypothetical protein MLD38_007035 [Melastoma candidum]|uniref:Uncharacterized protein n=1 Tax=Melastoma candidum TaxID=119954 RepID=A0ACB9RU09_9MYRT|nr:hypothetical protein MLD38_007035 [Melastoma candidum]
MAGVVASSAAFTAVKCSAQRPSAPPGFDRLKANFSSIFKPLSKEWEQLTPLRVDVGGMMKNASVKMLDVLIDSLFEFADQEYLPSQRNFAPVAEIGEAVWLHEIQGDIPHNFPTGVYIRNGANPLFGGLKSTRSMFGRSSHTWIEGEGMLHAIYFEKDGDSKWVVRYNNRHVETKTYKLEKQRNKPSFLPVIEGDSAAVLSGYLFNLLRFGMANKLICNTNVFEHAGMVFSISENQMPQEIDIETLKTLGEWTDQNWNRPFTSHPKRIPRTDELVTIGVDPVKPFMEVGVISGNGKLVHKVDLELERCCLCHEVGVTERYTVIMDPPLTIDLNRLIRGGPLIRFNKGEYARIGVMPHYGDVKSVHWFSVESYCGFHVFNCFEEGDEVIVWGCRALESMIPGPEYGFDKFEWFSKRFCPPSGSTQAPAVAEEGSFSSHVFEWRLNLRTGEVEERNLTGTDSSVEFPMINGAFTGLKNKYGYAQLVDSLASSKAGLPKYGGLVKLYFEEQCTFVGCDSTIKVEYHKFDDNVFCTGAAFVPKVDGTVEDDGWIITFVHDEIRDISQVYVVDTRDFTGEPVARITIPCRVPYGFHGEI